MAQEDCIKEFSLRMHDGKTVASKSFNRRSSTDIRRVSHQLTARVTQHLVHWPTVCRVSSLCCVGGLYLTDAFSHCRLLRSTMWRHRSSVQCGSRRAATPRDSTLSRKAIRPAAAQPAAAKTAVSFAA